MNTDDADDKTRVIGDAHPPAGESRVCPRCQASNPMEQLLAREYRCGNCNLEMAHLDYAPNGAVRGIFGWLRAPGEVILDRYQVESVLGKGGFGAAYLVDDLHLNRKRRALKEVPALMFDEYETGLLSKLDHPAIPDIIERRVVGGMVYMVLQFGGSRTLGSERKQSPGGRVPQAKLLPWMRQLCEVLAYLHGQKPPIIHRDLKPDNILLNEDERIMLIDFGIAKEAMPEALTRTLGRAATHGFSPLEQVIGKGTDERSDIYALGATFYALLTGRIPPAADERVNGVPLVPPSAIVPDVLPEIDEAILKSLSLKMEDRQQTVREFAEAVGVYAPGPSVLLGGDTRPAAWGQDGTRPPTAGRSGQVPPPAAPKPISRRMLLPALAGAVALAAAAYYVAFKPTAPPPVAATQAPPAAKQPPAAPTSPPPTVPAEPGPQAPATRPNPPPTPAAPAAQTNPPSAPVETAPKPQSTEEKLTGLISRLNGFPMDLKAFYREGERIGLTLHLPTEGFLHVFIVEPGGKATLIFPNKLVPDNRVKPGDITLPNERFRFTARPPYGRMWFVATLQAQPGNIYRQYSQGEGKNMIVVEWTDRQLLDFLQDFKVGDDAKASGAETRVCAKSGPCG